MKILGNVIHHIGAQVHMKFPNLLAFIDLGFVVLEICHLANPGDGFELVLGATAL